MNHALDDVTHKVERNIGRNFDLSDRSRQNEVNRPVFDLLVVLQCLEDVFGVQAIQKWKTPQAADCLFNPRTSMLGQLIQCPADARSSNHAVSHCFTMLDACEFRRGLESMAYSVAEI